MVLGNIYPHEIQCKASGLLGLGQCWNLGNHRGRDTTLSDQHTITGLRSSVFPDPCTPGINVLCFVVSHDSFS